MKRHPELSLVNLLNSKSSYISENIKELNKQQTIKPTLLDRAKDTSNALSNAALQISDIITGNKSEGMACKKEGMACNKEGMADYVCYRCGKYAYECQCSKKINVFNLPPDVS